MPKIIENIRERLLIEARRQVMEESYSAMTIRSVASACGVGIGTVYNYFSSKDMLVASFMLEDWQVCISQNEKGCQESGEPKEALQCVDLELRKFIKKYEPLFQDENAEISFATSFHQRHKQLRQQIANSILKLCQRQQKVDANFLADFVAESMITWIMEGRSFEEISSIILQIL